MLNRKDPFPLVDNCVNRMQGFKFINRTIEGVEETPKNHLISKP